MDLLFLLESDGRAREYFKSLPLDTQLAIYRNPGLVHSEEDLRQFADTLFHAGGMVGYRD